MKTSQPHIMFLLGGYDLEMITIKRMLEKHNNYVVIDRHLQWNNAFLSAYENEIRRTNDIPIYGIELVEDIPTTHNYHRIDHHNDFSHKPSSLEQVAQITGVPLGRYEQLVAANDKGYIPGMIAISATKEEIQEIRHDDRASQGISQEDELLAEISVRNHLTRHGNLLVVKSLTPHFSIISDLLYPYHSLLVYDEFEWCFYGEKKEWLLSQLSSEISNNKIYHGGGEIGYIGAVKGAYSKSEIALFVNQLMAKYGHIQLS